MPANQLVNPLAEENEGPSYGTHSMFVEYDSAASGNLVNGTVVAIETVAALTTTVVIKKATTTPDFLMLGVVVNAPTSGYTPGSSVEVVTQGVVAVLFDANNTTAGHLGIQSSTTAGSLTDSATATLAKTLGVILESVTIASGTALVLCLVGKM